MKAVYQFCYHHIFTKCGWQQDLQTGKFFFAKPAAVLEGVNVSGVIEQLGAHNLVMEYDTANAQGQFAAETFQGMVRGHVTSKTGLPRYTLYLNINGTRVQRTLIPQNPAKVNAQGQASQSAIEAQTGHMIMYVMKGEAPNNASFMEKCAVIIKDNDFQVIG